MTLDQFITALVGARVIDQAAVEDPDNYDDGVMLERVKAAHRRLALHKETERVAFETWLTEDTTLPATRQADGYADFTTELMWHTWKAATIARGEG